MQIKKTQICDLLGNWSVSWNFTFQLLIILQLYTLKICYFLKNSQWPKKVNDKCYIELMNLLKLFLTCQILSFKSGKISLWSKFSDRSLCRIPIEKRTQREKMHVAKTNACSNFSWQNKINTIKICTNNIEVPKWRNFPLVTKIIT